MWNGQNTFFFYVFNINLTNCVNFHLVVQQPLALSQKATNYRLPGSCDFLAQDAGLLHNETKIYAARLCLKCKKKC